MTEQHTWTTRRINDTARPFAVIGKNEIGDVIIAGGIETEDHARLIAAAPEMLAALESLLARSKQVPYQNWLEEDQKVACAAINKARGA